MWEYTLNGLCVFDNWHNIFRQTWNLYLSRRLVKFNKKSVQSSMSMRSLNSLPTNYKSLLTFGYTEFSCIIVSEHDWHTKTKREFPRKMCSTTMTNIPDF